MKTKLVLALALLPLTLSLASEAPEVDYTTLPPTELVTAAQKEVLALRNALKKNSVRNAKLVDVELYHLQVVNLRKYQELATAVMTCDEKWKGKPHVFISYSRDGKIDYRYRPSQEKIASYFQQISHSSVDTAFFEREIEGRVTRLGRILDALSVADLDDKQLAQFGRISQWATASKVVVTFLDTDVVYQEREWTREVPTAGPLSSLFFPRRKETVVERGLCTQKLQGDDWLPLVENVEHAQELSSRKERTLFLY